MRILRPAGRPGREARSFRPGQSRTPERSSALGQNEKTPGLRKPSGPCQKNARTAETIRAMLKKRPDGRNHPGHVEKTPGRWKPSGPCRKNARTAETIRAMSTTSLPKPISLEAGKPPAAAPSWPAPEPKCRPGAESPPWSGWPLPRPGPHRGPGTRRLPGWSTAIGPDSPQR